MDEISKYIINEYKLKKNNLNEDFISLCEKAIKSSLRSENLLINVPDYILITELNKAGFKKDIEDYLTVFYAKTIQATISAILFPIMNIDYNSDSSRYADCYDFIRLYALFYYKKKNKELIKERNKISKR